MTMCISRIQSRILFCFVLKLPQVSDNLLTKIDEKNQLASINVICADVLAPSLTAIFTAFINTKIQIAGLCERRQWSIVNRVVFLDSNNFKASHIIDHDILF